MSRMTCRFTTIAASMLILASCSKEQASNNQIGSAGPNSSSGQVAPSPNIQAVEQLVTSLDQFQKRPTLLPKDDEHHWRALAGMEGASLFGSIEVGCGGGHDRVEPVNPDMLNFNGHLISPDVSDTSEGVAFWILYDLGFYDRRTRAIRSRFGTQIFHCHVFSERMNRWTGNHPELSDQSLTPAGITYAQRTNIVFEFENEYRTELPLKGQVPVVSLRFTYELRPLLPGLLAQSRGSGAAKAYLDSDSGQWAFMEFRLQDPDLTYAPRTASRSTATVIDERRPDDPTPASGGDSFAEWDGRPETSERAYQHCRGVDATRENAIRRGGIDLVVNEILARQSDVLWNGHPIDLITLRQYLDLTATMRPQPRLVVTPQAGVSPERMRNVHRVVLRSGIC